jgi:serine/threonine-protein kinase
LALLNEQIEGKYEILGKIREGGMGAVYKVRHRLLDEVRVVKVVRTESEGKSAAAERFLHEAKVAIRLRHPNVAVLHDFAVDDSGTAFIVMEYIDGWSLLEVLQGYGPPPLSLTLEVARQALRALAYLHRQQIVHRDISPDNLMLTRDGEGQPLVKLIDLGIAKAMGASGGLTTTGVFLGKPRYASPEQFEGRGIGPQSDLYSFAVVLYELLTGRCPVHGQDAPSFMAGHLLRPPMAFEEVDPRGTVPDDLRAVILQALAKKPQERMPGAEELLRSIAEVQARHPLAKGDFDAVLDVLLPLGAPGGRKAEPPSGSTQVRLDWEFGAVQTPPPATRGDLTPTPAIGALLALPVSEPTRQMSEPIRGLPTEAGDLPLRRQEALDDTWARREIHRTVAPAPPASAASAMAPPPLSQPAEPDPQTPRTSRAPALAAAGVALALLGGGIGWYLSAQPSRPSPRPHPPAAASLPAAAPASPEPRAPASAAVNPPPPVTSLAVPASLPVPAVPQASPAVVEVREERFPTAPIAPTPPAAAPPSTAPPVRSRPEPPPQPTEPMRRGDFILRRGPGVSEPVPLDLPRYDYPAAAHGSGRRANVRVGVLVDEDGKVLEAVLRERDSSNLGFNEAALEAARKTRFQAATRDDIPGKMWTELIFEFAE